MRSNKLLAAALAVVLCLAALLSGCGKGAPAAKVGDQEITVLQLQNVYDNSAGYASYYGYTLDSAENVEAFQDYLLDSMIADAVKAYMARSAGMTLTDEEEAQAQATAKEEYDATYQTFLDAAEESGTDDKTAYANKLFTDALVRNGSTVNKLKKQLLTDAEDALLIEKHRTALLADKQLTPEELETRFNEEQAAQKEAIDADPSAYFTYETYASYGYGVTPLYMPEGFIRVRHILVEDEEIAKSIQAKLDAGEDFEALLKEHNTDPGMDDNEEGYLMGEGAGFVEPFLNAALALENDGDVSPVVQSDYGYHIIKRIGTEQSGAVAYADVQEAFDTFEQQSVDEQAYNEILTGWMADTSLVTRYPENYRNIGKAALALLPPSPAPETTAAPETTEAP